MPLPPVAYDPTTAIQEYMLEWVRDLLGVEEQALPDSVIAGLPAWKTTLTATRYVPTWATLAQQQRQDFDEGVCYELAANCVNRLQTLYADGEGAADMRAGRYDWLKREPLLRQQARAAFGRAVASVTGIAVLTPPLLRARGRSKADGYTSPDPFRAPLTGERPFAWIPTLVPQ